MPDRRGDRFVVDADDQSRFRSFDTDCRTHRTLIIGVFNPLTVLIYPTDHALRASAIQAEQLKRQKRYATAFSKSKSLRTFLSFLDYIALFPLFISTITSEEQLSDLYIPSYILTAGLWTQLICDLLDFVRATRFCRSSSLPYGSSQI